MKLNRLAIIFSLAVLALVLSACSGGGRASSTSWPGLAADSETAYLANGSAMYAIRLTDGQELWQYPLKASSKLSFFSNPVVTADGLVIVGSSGSEHNLIAIDPAKYSQNPTAPIGGFQKFLCSFGMAVCPEEVKVEAWIFGGAKDHWVASPLLAGNMLYAPNGDGTLYVFDLSIEGENKLVWQIDLGGKLWSQPAIDSEYVYVASLDHHVHAVNIATHKLAWVVDLDGANMGAPVTANGLLYVGSFATSLQALNTSDGSVAWTAPAKDWVWGGPTLNGDALYFADISGNFYTVNSADGKPLIDSAHPDGPILAPALLVNGNVILVTENGSVLSIDAAGKITTLETMAGKLYTTPVLAGDLILVAPYKGDALLIALDADGNQVWRFPAATK